MRLDEGGCLSLFEGLSLLICGQRTCASGIVGMYQATYFRKKDTQHWRYSYLLCQLRNVLATLKDNCKVVVKMYSIQSYRNGNCIRTGPVTKEKNIIWGRNLTFL
jgi:hypothetical protein